MHTYARHEPSFDGIYSYQKTERNDDMGRISTPLAHDIRTPLQMICSYAQMIQSELDDPDQPASRYARLLMENAECLKDMVTSELTKATGRIDVIHAARSLCRRMDAHAEARGISLLFSTNTASLTMRLDAAKYTRILQNLLTNAIRFTPEGGHVRVEMRALGDTIETTVSDSGPGIDPQRRKKVFERGETQGGLGLGLGIARKLAIQLGGSLELDPRPRNGASFTLRLPLSQSESRF